MTVLFEASLSVPQDEVWAHLREPDKIARWFGWQYDSLAAEIELILGGANEDGGHTLTFSGGDRFELAADGDRTRVRFVRDVQPGYDPIAEGWITFANQLAFAVEHHLGEDRRTLYLSGPRTPVGVEDVGRLGERYETVVGPGDAASGKVWFNEANQVGVTVDELGDGLLVVTQNPEDGSGSVVLSTFGFAGFDAVVGRWREWWASAGS